MTLVVGVLVASLLGSVHCAAMCGAFTCLYRRPVTEGAWRAHAAYNGGRLVSYLTLGALAGMLGSRVNELSPVAGIARPAAVLAGLLMMLWAASTIGASLGARVPVTLAPEWARRLLGQGLLAARDLGATTRAGLIGMLTTLLPCGWLYTFVVVAGGTGSALGGASVMLVFWAGTVPTMSLVAAGADRLLGPFQKRLPLVSAVVVLALGFLSLAGKLHSPAMSNHAHMAPVHVSR
ncbi:MAG TPA: sulfite exporter TauE/SafE family protein [Gemmatimonadaceae bacterium]|nr:sulfite exporter TauE/SafE family protein [Gemmatimonadaceae bacterium]